MEIPKELRRLLELPEQIRLQTIKYLERLATYTKLEQDHSLRKAEIYLAGVDAGMMPSEGKARIPNAITGKNAETRDAELLVLLNQDSEFQLTNALFHKAKLDLTASELTLKNLRLEAEMQMAAVNALGSYLPITTIEQFEPA